MKLLVLTILKIFINIYLYLRNIYISFVSCNLTYSKEKGMYIYTFYDINNKYNTLYFLNHKDFRDYLNKVEDNVNDNLQIIHAALITDTDYLVDLTDHIKSFSYYFKDPSKLPWKKVMDTVNYQTPYEKKLKMYIQSTNTKGHLIQHSERTLDVF